MNIVPVNGMQLRIEAPEYGIDLRYFDWPAPDQHFPRLDLLILHNSIYRVIKGIAGLDPTPPQVPAGATPLAYVRIYQAAAMIKYCDISTIWEPGK